jgi:hypothetical protein
MIKQARYICSTTVVIILLTVSVQADDEEDPAYVVQDGRRVPVRIIAPRPDSKPDVQRERVRVVDLRRDRAATARRQDTGAPPRDAWLRPGFEGTRFPRVVVRGRPDRWGRSWDRPRFLRRYVPYGSYGYGDPLGVQSGLEDAYFAGRYDERDYARWRWNRRDMAHRKARLLDKHAEALELGLGKLRQGDYARAVVGLTMAAKLNNGDPACRIHLAQARLALGQYEEAGKVLRRALQLQPNLVYVDLKLDEYYPQPEKFAECTDALAAWVRERPSSADVYFLLGYAEFQRGNFERAYAAFRKVARVMPKDALTLAYLEITRPPSD